MVAGVVTTTAVMAVVGVVLGHLLRPERLRELLLRTLIIGQHLFITRRNITLLNLKQQRIAQKMACTTPRLKLVLAVGKG